MAYFHTTVIDKSVRDLLATCGWKGIQWIVKNGFAQEYFSIGDEFTVNKVIGSSDTTITFRVVDFDKLMPDDISHSMVLESKYVYSSANGAQVDIQNDAPEALYYCENGLVAGTYNFTWTYVGGQIVSGTYEFTTTVDIPTGGQIVIGISSVSTPLTSCKISTYATVGDTTALESNIAISSGSSGTSLGTTNEKSSDNANMNCCQRLLFGSNNYAQSALRQFLNSNGSYGSFWQAQTKFDRTPTWLANVNLNGFLNGLDSEFVNAIHTAKIPCRTNNSGVMEVDSLNGDTYSSEETYNLEDKMFILSRPEIYGTWDSSSLKDGEQLAYYVGKLQSDLIKRNANGTARIYWLRSPYPSHASYIRNVSSDGALNYSNAGGSLSIAPACIIG